MSSRQKLPPHGTAERYRHERKTGRTCEKCKAHMAGVRREQRANRTAAAARSKLRLVDAQAGDTSDDKPSSPPDAPATTPEASTGARSRGQMEVAVEEDIGEIDAELRVPFHRSLSVLAIELAREIDEPATAATARRDARKQLFEVLRSLRTQKEGSDDSALAIVLEQAGFGTPLVPGRPA